MGGRRGDGRAVIASLSLRHPVSAVKRSPEYRERRTWSEIETVTVVVTMAQVCLDGWEGTISRNRYLDPRTATISILKSPTPPPDHTIAP